MPGNTNASGGSEIAVVGWNLLVRRVRSGLQAVQVDLEAFPLGEHGIHRKPGTQLPVLRRRSGHGKRLGPLAELERQAPGVAHHDEPGRVGLGRVGKQGGAGPDQTGTFGSSIVHRERKMQDERRLVGVIRDGRLWIAVNLEHDAAGPVGEEVHVRWFGIGTDDGEAQMGREPPGVAAGIGNVKGDVFEFHGTLWADIAEEDRWFMADDPRVTAAPNELDRRTARRDPLDESDGRG